MTSRSALGWSNLLKVQLVKNIGESASISVLSPEERMEIVRWQRELFLAELSYVKPSAILFLTGSLHWVAEHMFEHAKHSVSKQHGFEVVKVGGLEIPMVKTWHPNARARKDGPSVAEGRAAAIGYLREQFAR